MTLLVRDEEDIIRANIDFHLNSGIDFIIATDNLSTDATTDILREYERQGVLHYIFQPEDDYRQSRWVTYMARLARTRFDASWIINSDADEFWYAGHRNLKSVLEAVPVGTDAVAVDRSNFLPSSSQGRTFFADLMTIRERQSLNSLDMPLPPKTCHRAFPDVEVAQGNHSAGRQGEPFKAISADILILHFPLRTYRQFENKIVKGGAAYERNPGPDGATWRLLYERYKCGALENEYFRQVPTADQLEAGLQDGRYIPDDRLKIALQELRRRQARG